MFTGLCSKSACSTALFRLNVRHRFLLRAMRGAQAPKGRPHLSPGQAQRRPGFRSERHGGLKGHFKNGRRRGFEVPLQGTWMLADATRGCAALVPGYGASGPLGRRRGASVPASRLPLCGRMVSWRRHRHRYRDRCFFVSVLAYGFCRAQRGRSSRRLPRRFASPAKSVIRG